MCGHDLPEVVRLGRQFAIGRGFENGIARRRGRGITACSLRSGDRIADRCRSVASQLLAQRLDHARVVRRRTVSGGGDCVERPQAHHVVACRIQEGRSQGVQRSGRDSGVASVEEGAHGVDCGGGNLRVGVDQQRSDGAQRTGIANTFEHPQQTGPLRGVGRAESLQHLPQGGPPDDREARDRGLDRHGIVIGQ